VGVVIVAAGLAATAGATEKAQPVATISLGGGGIVMPAVGSVWATDTVFNRLVRIDPATNRATARIRAGSRPLGIAYGARSLWVASSFSGDVIRVNPRTRKIVKRIASGISPYDVAFGAGAAWASNESEGNVVRVSPRRNRVVARIRGFGRPNGVTFAFGSIWVADLARGRVARINPARNRITARAPVPAADWITASPDSLWISSEQGKVFRLDPQTLAVEAVIPVGANPLASAWIGGELWVPNIDDDTVSIVSPATNSVGTTLAVADGPISVASAGGDVWITHEHGPLWRLPKTG
jgi:DNA-binding beta-propeller fold protein YncE